MCGLCNILIPLLYHYRCIITEIKFYLGITFLILLLSSSIHHQVIMLTEHCKLDRIFFRFLLEIMLLMKIKHLMKKKIK